MLGLKLMVNPVSVVKEAIIKTTLEQPSLTHALNVVMEKQPIQMVLLMHPTALSVSIHSNPSVWYI